MYSAPVTKSQVSLASQSLGFEIIYHSISEVEQFNSHLESLTERNEKGDAVGWRKDLRPNGLLEVEQSWILNETVLCKLDFRYCATRYVFINDTDKNIVRFSPNVAQNILIDIWSEAEEKGHPIMMLELKARRLGVSTVDEIAIAHRAQFCSGSTALLASSEPDKSRDMADMMKLIFDQMPWWMMPQKTSDRAGELIEFYGIKSKITIRWGNQKSGIGRGGSPNLVHLSELPDFDDPEEKVGAALLHAILETPSVFVALESTAKGKGNWWHDRWEDAKEHWPNTRLRPIFLPWFVGRDIYPMPAWLSLHPIPSDWKPLDITIAHAERAADYTQSNDLLRKYLGSDWKMPLKQMWYWEMMREEARRTKSLHKFLEEMPADDIEAFQSPHSNVFDADLIYEIKSEQRSPLHVYGIQAPQDELPLRFQPNEYEIDKSKEPLIIRPHWNSSLAPVEYRFVPLIFNGYNGYSPIGKLFIYELPKEGEEYGLGIDPSYGKGKDNSALEVLRKRTLGKCEAQAAEYVNPYLDSHRLWPIAMAVGDFYSTWIDGTRKQARMVIELAANGQEVQRELQDRGWWNFHKRVSDDVQVVNFSTAHHIGWSTDRKSRPRATQGLEKAITSREIEIHSPWLLEELGGLVWDAEAQRLEAGHGSKDDRYMALAIVRESFRQTETPAMRASVWEQKMEREKIANYYPEFKLGEQAQPIASDWMKEHEWEFAGELDSY